MARTKSNGTNTSTATIGFEAKLWLTVTAQRESAGEAPLGIFVANMQAKYNHPLMLLWTINCAPPHHDWLAMKMF